MTSCVHLRLHSEYSVVDGIVRIDDAVARARDDHMPALALTDLGNLFGLVKFYKATRGKGVKPIIGADCWLANEEDRNAPQRILLLARHRAGYLRLCELLTEAYRQNQHRGRAELSRQWFAGADNSGLIALSGAHLGDVGQALEVQNRKAARAAAEFWAAHFPHSYYLEIQRPGQPHVEAIVQETLDLAADLGLPVVATHPIQFITGDDYKAHEARVCIAEGHILGDKRRPRLFTEDQYFKTQAEMAELFADVPEALENTLEIARRCNITLELGKARLPDFPTPPGMTINDYMVQLAQVGLNERLELLYPDPTVREQQRPTYEARLSFEADTIIQMGFPGYFLIVADFINWAKRRSTHTGRAGEPVPVGPGRGSGAGSLVAYSLGITDLDPLAYDLLFERFLNPERVSMPDFDIDFCQDGREHVINYVKRAYGVESVSQIATFGTMAAKAVVRDVGRVLDLSYNFVDQLAKLIPNELGISLDKAREQEPQLNERAAAEEEVADLLDLAGRLEGLTRNVGMHAGGVLIAPGKLTDFCPLYAAQGSESFVSQYDKDDVEAVGLVKFDFLGLRTLTILDWAMRFIRLLDPTSTLNLETLPLDDKATYQLLKAANTTAVFQLESRGLKELMKRLLPDTFEDIIALVALYRPGPLGSGMVDDFINRKHGRAKAEYFHPSLEPTLKPTYGVIVYQEQVMLVAQILAGYTLGGADMLRRAMGKKKPEEMAKHRGLFVTGAVERGVDGALAEHLFDLMEKFAEYGFNKSHSAAYALVAYHTAYLKAHHCAAFMAATLSSEMDDTDKVRIFYEDTLVNGVAMLPPDVNASNYRFEPVSPKAIRYGLGGIKGTGEAAISVILAERQKNGPFKDLFDFCRRTDKRTVNRRVIEALVRAGAFDTLHDERAVVLASVGLAMDWAEQASQSDVQVSLFGDDEPAACAPPLVKAKPWGILDKLQNEKQALGYYFSGHPFDAYRNEIPFIKTRLERLQARRDANQLIAGIVLSSRVQMGRRGKMAFVLLDDGKGQIELAVYSEVFDRDRSKIKEDQLLVVEAKVSDDQYSGGLRAVAERLFTLGEARARFARALRVSLNGNTQPTRLGDMLKPYVEPGACPIAVQYHNGTACCELLLGDDWRVRLDDALLESLKEWLSPQSVRVEY